MSDVLWPAYGDPSDLERIEAVPLAERGLPATTYELLRRAASRWPDAVGLRFVPDAAHFTETTERTYAKLLAEVHRLANALRGLGVGRTDAVALLSPNCADLVPALLAAQLAGVAAPVNQGLAADHVVELLRLSGARVVLAAGPELDEPTWRLALDLAARGQLDAVIALRPTGAAGVAPDLPSVPGVLVAHLHDVVDGLDPTGFAGAPPAETDLASLFHTGGTTGTPKLAAHTHANEVTDAWMIAANEDLPADAVVLAALPLFHVNALVVTLLAPLFKGQPVLWLGPLGYRDLELYGVFWRLVEHHRIGAMSAVPTVYAVLSGVPVDADVSSLRFAMVGASPLPPAVREGFESHSGVALVEGYGLTEATCASVRSFPTAPRPGSVGQRLPYQRLRVVRVGEDGWAEVPPGEVGTLLVSGPTVFPGYVVGHDADGFRLDGLGKLRDGWLDTGDLARVDTDGFVVLTGRTKDLIIRGGHNIDPAVVEDALLSHPAVTGVGAVGRPDPHSGEVPVAYVTLAPGSPATPEELRAWAAATVSEPAAAPKSVTVLDALPVTDVGKPYKLGLRALATRSAVESALAEVPGLRAVVAVVEDGSVVAELLVDDDAAGTACTHALAAYAVSHRVATVR